MGQGRGRYDRSNHPVGTSRREDRAEREIVPPGETDFRRPPFGDRHLPREAGPRNDTAILRNNDGIGERGQTGTNHHRTDKVSARDKTDRDRSRVRSNVAAIVRPDASTRTFGLR